MHAASESSFEVEFLLLQRAACISHWEIETNGDPENAVFIWATSPIIHPSEKLNMMLT